MRTPDLACRSTVPLIPQCAIPTSTIPKACDLEAATRLNWHFSFVHRRGRHVVFLLAFWFAAAPVLSAQDLRNIRTGWEIPSEVYADQPYVVVTDDGAWLCLLTTGPGREGTKGQHIVSLRSEDQGRTWSRPVDVEPTDGHPACSYSRDGGHTWSTPATPTADSSNTPGPPTSSGNAATANIAPGSIITAAGRFVSGRAWTGRFTAGASIIAACAPPKRSVTGGPG
jgi:hypothetical protein